MSSPLPPDEWPSQPSASEDAFYEADPDEDTGPVHIVTPPHEDATVEQTGAIEQASVGEWPTYRPPPPEVDTFAGRFTAPLTIDPRTVPVKSNRVRPGPVAAGVAGVLAVGLAIWLFWPSSDAPEDSSTASAPSTTQKPVDAEAQAKLLRLLPAGYPSSGCKQVDPPTNALAKIDCTQNADTGGPPSATYTLVRDKSALRAAFDGVVGGIAVVNCPGNIQSPGPWRRNATPQQVSGTLVCGLQQNRPSLAWTDDIVLLLGEVHADTTGPTLDQLYAWWSSHS
jgi:hypothetical protein